MEVNALSAAVAAAPWLGVAAECVALIYVNWHFDKPEAFKAL